MRTFIIVSLFMCGTAYGSDVTIFTYDSMVDGGIAAEIQSRLQSSCKCKVDVEASGGAREVINRARSSRGEGVKIVLGIDQDSFSKSRDSFESLGQWKPQRLSQVPEKFQAADFVPFQYGVFSLVVDRSRLQEKSPPKSLKDLLASGSALILEDPASSGPGAAFMQFSKQAAGAGFWASLQAKRPLMAADWTSAETLFKNHAAPMIWSYSTDEAYYRERGENQISAVLFDEGNPVVVEGAGILKDSVHSTQDLLRGQMALELLLDPEIQRAIPHANFMFPVVSGTPLPVSFTHLR